MSAGAIFLVLATWAHGMGALLAAATIAAYLIARLLRDREGLILDVGILAGVAAGATFGWWPYGWLLAALIVASVTIACAGGWLRRNTAAWLATGTGLLGAVVCAFLLTIVVTPNHSPLPGTNYDPPADYAGALGGNGAVYLDEYRIAAGLPPFVGNATYRGEQLLMSSTWAMISEELDEVGEYHGRFNMLPDSPPELTSADRNMLDQRRPAELLLLGPTDGWMGRAVGSLAPYYPTVLRSKVFHAGSYVFYAELLSLRAYPPLPAR